MIVDVDGGGDESARPRQTSPPSGVSGTGVAVAGILVAGAYMAQRGFCLGDLEFFVLAAYLALILIFLMSLRNEASNNTTTKREAFDEEDLRSDGCTLDAQGNLKNDKDDDGCLYALYSMPRRVVDKIGPGIDKIGAVFRGQDPSGGESPEYVRLHEGNVYLTDAEKKGEDPAGRLRQVAAEYKRMDHALCLLKHARPEEYRRILRDALQLRPVVDRG